MAAKAEEAAATSGRCFQGVARNEFGYKMLQSMGWSEGKVRCRAPLHSPGPLRWPTAVLTHRCTGPGRL